MQSLDQAGKDTASRFGTRRLSEAQGRSEWPCQHIRKRACAPLTSVFSATCKVRPWRATCIQCVRLGSGLECANYAHFGLLTLSRTEGPQGKTALIRSGE